ncbi:tRNA-dependent cyclodipeptide synthase [Candidatus Gracilibacteria bacterium]|nr:tRNA-dependent cyclodipeptide synthase [Candidatus Gracilibacteria bacterium]
MKIKTYLNTTEQEIITRKFNILIGISLGNKYFSREHIRDYLLWAITNTNESIVVLIPDKIHALNYEIRCGYKKMRANTVAIRDGNKMENIVQNILNEFTPEQRALVLILKWHAIETNKHQEMVRILYNEFEKNVQFKNEIIKIVKESINLDKVADLELEKLAAYPLEELPMLISGIEFNNIKYELLPYPGISSIDNLVVGLQDGSIFPEISKKLNILNKLRLIEAYDM